MKVGTLTLHLTKDTHVLKKGVTPIEVCLLAAMHNAASKGDPFETNDKGEPKVDHAEDRPKVKVTDTNGVVKEVDWSNDLELQRLRMIYGAKVDLLDKVRDLPKDFAEAVQKGKGIVVPSAGAPMIAKFETTVGVTK